MHHRKDRTRRLTIVALVALGIVLGTDSRADKTSRLCTKTCKQEKKSCLNAFKQAFKIQKADCGTRSKEERKVCKKSAKQVLKVGKNDCKTAFKAECKACCKGGGTSCPFDVCGDGKQTGSEQCDAGDRIDGDGCSAECLTEGLASGPLGLHTFSVAKQDSQLHSQFVPDLGVPEGQLVLQAGEPDANGVAEVTTVGGPFYVTTDVDESTRLAASARFCSKIVSCTGTIYCDGGANVDVVIELDSLTQGLECAKTDRCLDQRSNPPEPLPCCDNACEGFVDPDADIVQPVTSKNKAVITRVADVDADAPDSGPGAMILICEQINRQFQLEGALDCSQQQYGDVTEPIVYTTGCTTSKVKNHCPVPEGKPGTGASATLEFTLRGENFNCFKWGTAASEGAFANTIPLEEPTDVVLGDTSTGAILCGNPAGCDICEDPELCCEEQGIPGGR